MANEDALDRFAGLAMHAILSNQDTLAAVTRMGSQAVTYNEAIAAIVKKSYDVAAAMIVERAERRRGLPEMTFKPDEPKFK